MPTYRKIFRLFAIVSFLLFTKCLLAQTMKLGPDDTVRVELTITDGGFKVPTSELTPLYLFTRMNAKWKKYYEAWNRLKNAVYVTYPYAKAASRVIQEINGELAGVNNRRKRKAIIKSHEKELRSQFTSKLKNLSVYQGKVLMKLICRETGNNCYEILDEYKGDFNAVLYQGVARLFGSSLKQSYNPNGEDQSIEILARQAAMYYGY